MRQQKTPHWYFSKGNRKPETREICVGWSSRYISVKKMNFELHPKALVENSISSNEEIKNGGYLQKEYGVRKKNAISRGQDSNINDLIIKRNILSFIFHSWKEPLLFTVYR